MQILDIKNVVRRNTYTEFLAALDDFVADIADQTKALRFYTCLGNVKLYVLLEYGYPKVKINGICFGVTCLTSLVAVKEYSKVTIY